MSQQIANVNLASASVGTTGSVSWGSLLTPPTIHQQMRPGQTSAATLLIHNESGAQLLLSFPDTVRSISFPAGKWAALQIRANELSLTYKVTAIAPSPLFTSLLVDFYWPGEPIDPMGTLGNSPIGGPAVAVTQVIQDGQPNAQTIVESTPSGQPQNVLITTDGNATFQGDVTGKRHLLVAGGVIDWNAGVLRQAYSTPQSGSSNFQEFFVWNGSAGVQALAIGDAWVNGNPNTAFGSAGGVQRLAQQGTAGSFGVPMIVAQTVNQSIAVTTDTTLITFSPSTGLYMLVGTFTFSNVANGTITFRVTYADPNGGTPTQYMITNLNGTPTTLNAVTFLSGTGTFAGYGPTFYAASGTNIVVHYQDSTGTPADHVTAQLIRLA